MGMVIGLAIGALGLLVMPTPFRFVMLALGIAIGGYLLSFSRLFGGVDVENFKVLLSLLSAWTVVGFVGTVTGILRIISRDVETYQQRRRSFYVRLAKWGALYAAMYCGLTYLLLHYDFGRDGTWLVLRNSLPPVFGCILAIYYLARLCSSLKAKLTARRTAARGAVLP